MLAHQMTSSTMSTGQMNSPYSRPWLCPVSRPMIPSVYMTFHAQAHQTPSRSLHMPRVPTSRGSM